MVYGYGDHSKQKFNKDDRKKWTHNSSKGPDSERFVSRNMSPVLMSLMYNKVTSVLPEHKNGMCIYSGSPLTFPEWTFKTRAAIEAFCMKTKEGGRRSSLETPAVSPARSTGGDVDSAEMPVSEPDEEDTVFDHQKYKETMSKILNALGGEAFQIAMELETSKLYHRGKDMNDENCGHERLITEVQKMAFTTNEHEARQVLRHFLNPGGILARQSSEPMHHYITRRIRAWRVLR